MTRACFQEHQEWPHIRNLQDKIYSPNVNIPWYFCTPKEKELVSYLGI